MTALRFRIMGCRPSYCRPVNARGYSIRRLLPVQAKEAAQSWDCLFVKLRSVILRTS
jgi:hypothetical protein